MDPNHAESSYEDPYSLSPCRSIAGSQVSSTDGLFQNLYVTDSPQSSNLGPRPSLSSLETAPSRACLNPLPSHSDPYLTSSVAGQYRLAIQGPSSESFAAEWVKSQAGFDATPLVTVEPILGFSNVPAKSSTGETMSAVAISSLDLTSFNMSNRSSFPWPSEPVPSQGLLPQGYPYASSPESGLSATRTARSLTSSPPNAASLSSEDQREHRLSVTRRRSQQRRQMRTQQRAARTGGSPYTQAATVSDASSQSPLPVYAPTTTMSMLTSPTPTIPSQYSYTDASQSSMYSYGTAPVPSPSYVPSATQGYYATYGQQSPVTSQYGTPVSLAYTGLHQIVSPPVAERVVAQRPKPQCWEHGCNGRQFSTFSNLLRHQRERSGQATKAICPNCGAEFTRTTARNGHLAHDKCKQRRKNSTGCSTESATSTS